MDDTLNKIIKEYGGKEYEGTDMLEDNQKIIDDSKNIHVKELEDSPFMDYGFGIVAFFQLMRTLIYLYVFISIVGLFLMWLYTFGNAIEGDRNGFVTQVSMGNYGFTAYKCFTQYVNLRDTNHLSCTSGRSMSELKYSGIVPDIDQLKTKEGKLVGNDYCGAFDQIETQIDCMPYLN